MKKSLIALAFGTLALGMSEFVMMGILPDIARSLGVSIPEAGHLISAYALGVCFGAPLTVLVARTRPLKQILLALTAMIAAGNLCAMLAEKGKLDSLPAAVAVAGGMLGIKPLITIKEGKVVMAGKARGLPGAYVALFKKIEERGGISTCADALAGYTLAPREVQPIQTYLQENLGRSEALVRQIGCVIGTHAGPGAFGLAFFDNGLVID